MGKPVKGRPAISLLEPRYPEQETIRQALNVWTDKQESLQDAADELCISYRLLSIYRHGQRYIPERIAEFLGYEPIPMSYKAKKPRVTARDVVIKSAVEFITAIRRKDSNFVQREKAEQLSQAVTSYKRTYRPMLERERNGR